MGGVVAKNQFRGTRRYPPRREREVHDRRRKQTGIDISRHPGGARTGKDCRVLFARTITVKVPVGPAGLARIEVKYLTTPEDLQVSARGDLRTEAALD